VRQAQNYAGRFAGRLAVGTIARIRSDAVWPGCTFTFDIPTYRFCRPIPLVFRQASGLLHGLFQQLRHVQKYIKRRPACQNTAPTSTAYFCEAYLLRAGHF
jgi:hypothetical protein